MRSSPLEAAHEAAGATFTDFAGYRMPVRYSSDLAEHHAVRRAAGVFDLSHMAEIGVTGAGAVPFLDHALAGSFGAMPVGRAKYSLLLADDGGILDDLVVYRTDEDVFLVVAKRRQPRRGGRCAARRADGFDVEVSDDSDSTALVAIQGPAAAGTLDALVVADRLQPETPLDELGYYRVLHALFDGADVLVARTGYTGEDGFEVYVDRPSRPSSGTRCSTPGPSAASYPPASRHGTPCGSRRACRSTGTNSVPTSAPRRPDSVASSRRTATSSGQRGSSPPTTPACSSGS